MLNTDANILINKRMYAESYDAIVNFSKQHGFIDKLVKCKLFYHAPLNQTAETVFFNKMIKELMVKGNYNDFFIFHNQSQKCYIVYNETIMNFYDFISKVNFNHLFFDNNDIALYNANHIFPILGPKMLKEFGQNHYEGASIKSKKYVSKFINYFFANLKIQETVVEKSDDLLYEEKLAMLVYSKHTAINKILGNPENICNFIHDIGGHITQEETMGRCMITAAISAHGLNKVSPLNTVEEPYVYRYDSCIGGALLPLAKCMENVLHNKVISWKTFMSTTTNHVLLQCGGIADSDYHIIVKNARGKALYNILQSHGYNHEQEYLIPPNTQFKWTGYSQINDKTHVFTLEGVNVLSDNKIINVVGQTEHFIDEM